jgi:23S rRNA (cytosine1962-C5)-methyltransferase
VSASERIRLILRPGRERPVLEGHPWLFSGAVAAAGGPARAPLAEVFAADGTPLGVAFHSPGARLRARLVARDPAVQLDRRFFRTKLEQALALRRIVVPPDDEGFRVLNAEGDGIPGWIVDRFGDVLVSQISCFGLEALRAEAYAALAELFPDAAIVHLGDLAARREEGLERIDEVIAGELVLPARVPFRESGLLFEAEIGGGQKTGFYCDQRENRARVAELAGGQTVLDLFAHAGAFGLYALRAGARAVTAVESSPRFAALAEAARAANGVEDGRTTWVTADVFTELRQRDERYGVVVCDPPPLARRRADLERAARAYKDLNRLALAHVEPGGFLATFTCSGAVDARLFRQILFAAAVEAGRPARLLAPLAAAPDHPVSIAHPEGEYLKGWLLEVGGERPGDEQP